MYKRFTTSCSTTIIWPSPRPGVKPAFRRRSSRPPPLKAPPCANYASLTAPCGTSPRGPAKSCTPSTSLVPFCRITCSASSPSPKPPTSRPLLSAVPTRCGRVSHHRSGFDQWPGAGGTLFLVSTKITVLIALLIAHVSSGIYLHLQSSRQDCPERRSLSSSFQLVFLLFILLFILGAGAQNVTGVGETSFDDGIESGSGEGDGMESDKRENGNPWIVFRWGLWIHFRSAIRLAWSTQYHLRLAIVFLAGGKNLGMDTGSSLHSPALLSDLYKKCFIYGVVTCVIRWLVAYWFHGYFPPQIFGRISSWFLTSYVTLRDHEDKHSFGIKIDFQNINVKLFLN